MKRTFQDRQEEGVFNRFDALNDLIHEEGVSPDMHMEATLVTSLHPMPMALTSLASGPTTAPQQVKDSSFPSPEVGLGDLCAGVDTSLVSADIGVGLAGGLGSGGSASVKLLLLLIFWVCIKSP